MKKLIVLVALLIAVPVFADTFTLNCDPVTTGTDGQPVQGLKGYKWYVSKTSGAYTTPAGTTTATTFTYTQITAGVYFAVVTAYTDTAESSVSNEVTFSVSVKPPMPPTKLTVR